MVEANPEPKPHALNPSSNPGPNPNPDPDNNHDPNPDFSYNLIPFQFFAHKLVQRLSCPRLEWTPWQ